MDGPVAGEHDEIDAVEREPRERPRRGNRPERLRPRKPRDRPDPHALEPGVAYDGGIDLRRHDLRPEGLGEGEHDLLPAPEGRHPVVHDRDVHGHGAPERPQFTKYTCAYPLSYTF